MMRRIHPLTTLVCLLVLPALGFSQSYLESEPCPGVEPESSGCELVAWSDLQQPTPLPDAESMRSRQPQAQADAEPQSVRTQQPSLQVFAGVIVKDGDKYLLKAADHLYPIGAAETVRQYEGRKVRITGILDAATNTIDIESIDLAF